MSRAKTRLNILFNVIWCFTSMWVTFKFISIVIPTNFQFIQVPNIETKFSIVLHPNNFNLKWNIVMADWDLDKKINKKMTIIANLVNL